MQEVLASTLPGTRVLSTGGQELGTLQQITFDTDSGYLESVIIQTEYTTVFSFERDADDRVELPADLIESLSDHLVVRPPDVDTAPGLQ